VAVTQSRRILVAVNNLSVRQLVSHVLQSSDWDLIYCTSVAEAKQLLHQHCDLIFCTLQFDGSRMFDLLQYAKADSQIKPIPFMALKITDSVLPESTVKAVMKTARLSGADACVNLAQWRKQLGDEPAYEKLRNTIRQLLVIHPA
jgi:CheY-like chemotaxis protein